MKVKNMASDDEMPVLSTEETGELEMPRLEVEAEPESDDAMPSTSQNLEQNKTSFNLQDTLKISENIKILEDKLESVHKNFNELFDKTCIYLHEDVIREREKQFEKSGKNEWLLPSTIFQGLKYRYILNGCNRDKTLRFYSCYSCIMMKKIPFYKDFIDSEAPIPTIVVENGRINNINSDRPNDVSHLCTPKLTIAKRGTNMLVDLYKVSCQFPSMPVETLPNEEDGEDVDEIISLDNNRVNYQSKVVLGHKYEFYCGADSDFEMTKKKKIFVLSCASCEKLKQNMIAVNKEMTVYVPQVFFQDGLFIHINPDMPLNSPHLCMKNFLDKTRQKRIETMQFNSERLKQKLEWDLLGIKNGTPEEKASWKILNTERVKQLDTASTSSSSLNQTRKEKDATRQRLRRTIMTPEEYDQMRSVNAERQRTRRSQDLRESRDKEAAKRRMQGVVITSDELAKFKSVVLNSKTKRSDSSGVEIKIPKLRQNQENAQESEPFIDTIVKEEPKSPRGEEIDEEPKTLNDLLLNLCSESAGNVNKEQQLEEPLNLEQDSINEIPIQMQMRSQMVKDTVAAFLQENARYLRPSKVPIEKKLGLKSDERNNSKKTWLTSEDRAHAKEMKKVADKFLEENQVFKRASLKERSSAETKLSEVPFLKEIKQELEIEPETSEFALDVNNQKDALPLLQLEDSQTSDAVMSNLLLTEPDQTYINDLVMKKLAIGESQTYILRNCKVKDLSENMIVYESVAYPEEILVFVEQGQEEGEMKKFYCRDCDYLRQKSFINSDINIPTISVLEEGNVKKTYTDPDFPNELVHFCRLTEAKVLLSSINLPRLRKKAKPAKIAKEITAPSLLSSSSPHKSADASGNPLQLLSTAINAIHHEKPKKDDEDYMEEDDFSPSEEEEIESDESKKKPFQMAKKKRGRPPKQRVEKSDEPPTKRFHQRYSLRETIKSTKAETPELESEEEQEKDFSLPKISPENTSFNSPNVPNTSSFTSSPLLAKERDIRKIAAQNWKMKQRKNPMNETPTSKQLNRLNFGNDYSGYTMVFVDSEKFPGVEFIFIYDPSTREYLCTACQNSITHSQLMKWDMNCTPARLEVSDFGILTPPIDSLHVCLPKQPPSISLTKLIPMSKATATSRTSPQSGPRILKLNKPRFVPVKLSDLEKAGIPKTTEDMPKLLPPESVDDEDAKTDSSEPPELSAFPKAPTLRFVPVSANQSNKITIVRHPAPPTDTIAKRLAALGGDLNKILKK